MNKYLEKIASKVKRRTLKSVAGDGMELMDIHTKVKSLRKTKPKVKVTTKPKPKVVLNGRKFNRGAIRRNK